MVTLYIFVEFDQVSLDVIRCCTPFLSPQDTFHEEMYSLDNDSFLNSLEAMTVTWPDYGSGVSTGSSTCARSSHDSDV